MKDNWAIVPVKGLADSKTRLSPFLGDKRKLLVEALLSDVLRSVTKSKLYSTVLVTSPDQQVASVSKIGGVSFLRQPSTGLNRALELANELALKERAESATTILADIPLVEPADFREIFDLSNTKPRVVMAPSLKGGTNIMLASPPGIIRPNYGRWSYSKHLRQAQITRVPTYSIANSRVSFDVDTPADLAELRLRDRAGRTKAGRVVMDSWRSIELPRIYS